MTNFVIYSTQTFYKQLFQNANIVHHILGTSLEAIRAVVSSGKICVLNLHPQSLKLLRSSDLKPYTVLVAPPSLEKLRQKRIRAGEPYKVLFFI